MTHIATKRKKIVTVSVSFGLFAGIMCQFGSFSVFAAILIGIIVATILAIILWLVWQDNNSGTKPTLSAVVQATISEEIDTPAVKLAAKSRSIKETLKPEVLGQARDGGPDDLKMIKGVGPALEKALQINGVFHFDQIGSWTKHDALWFDKNVKGAGGRILRDEWIKQARILSEGGITEFTSKVKKGGVS